MLCDFSVSGPLRSRQIDVPFFPGDPLCFVRTVVVLSDIDVRVVLEKLDKRITLTSNVETQLRCARKAIDPPNNYLCACNL